MRLAICVLFLFCFSFSQAEAGEKKKAQFIAFIVPVIEQAKQEIEEETGEEIKLPNSLPIAQGAEESAWGTKHPPGNLFGLTNGKGKPRKFRSVKDGAKEYFRNFLSHRAYEKLRGKLEQGVEDPIVLARALEDYSENPRYIRNISSIIRVNRLEQYDW